MTQFAPIPEEIVRLLHSTNLRDHAHMKQALNDAEACRESRRVSVTANGCDCFCCSLDKWVKVKRLVTVAWASGCETPAGIAGHIFKHHNVRVDLTHIEQLLGASS